MNKDTVYIFVRFGLVSAATLCVRRGYVSQDFADSWINKGTPYIVAGLLLYVIPAVEAWWRSKRRSAFAHLASIMPSGTPPALVESMLRAVARRGVLTLAHQYHLQMRQADVDQLTKAMNAVQDTLADHGYGDPATLAYLTPQPAARPADVVLRQRKPPTYADDAIAALAQQCGVSLAPRADRASPAVPEAVAATGTDAAASEPAETCAGELPSPGSWGRRVCALPRAHDLHSPASVNPARHPFVATASSRSP